jgi:putative glutamine amidotransferase
MIIALSQRVDLIESYNERRDSLDQRWFSLLDQCGITPLLIPNNPQVAKGIIERVECGGVILTGGGDILAYGGNSPERDATEKFLLEYAILNQLPVLGVCRGMQVIQNYFGVQLEKVENHLVCRHSIKLEERFEMVNSFHAWGAKSTVDDLQILAKSNDGVVEAVKHLTYPIKGIMWHPERESSLAIMDREIIVNMFKRLM